MIHVYLVLIVTTAFLAHREAHSKDPWWPLVYIWVVSSALWVGSLLSFIID